jgi:hypothetical protein
MPRRAPHRIGGVVIASLLLASGCGGSPPRVLSLCTSGAVVLTTEQTANAATIAAVGKRLGVPNHAVTVALATALQESGLRNLDYGDRDSLGLFQQRPSQGWGPPATVRTPRLAAASFYTRLLRVRGWAALPVTEAAQKVQRSAAPEAYAQWEDASRTLARALTGEVPAGLACQFPVVGKAGPTALLREAAVAELGPGGLTRTRTPAVAWTSASWLVAQASSYGVTRVSLAGKSWTAKRGTWKADQRATTLTWS